MHTDDFWHVIVPGGTAPFLPESNAQNQVVMTAIQRVVWTYVASGFTTVVDGIIGPRMLPHFLNACVQDEAAVPRLAGRRPASRPRRGVPRARTGPDALLDEEPVIGLWDQFADLGPLGRHAIDTTAQTPDETLDAVRRAVAGGELLLRLR